MIPTYDLKLQCSVARMLSFIQAKKCLEPKGNLFCVFSTLSCDFRQCYGPMQAVFCNSDPSAVNKALSWRDESRTVTLGPAFGTPFANTIKLLKCLYFQPSWCAKFHTSSQNPVSSHSRESLSCAGGITALAHTEWNEGQFLESETQNLVSVAML